MTITEIRKNKNVGKTGLYGMSPVPMSGKYCNIFLVLQGVKTPRKNGIFWSPLWQNYPFWRFIVRIMGVEKIIKCFKLSIYNSNKICGSAKNLFPSYRVSKKCAKRGTFFTSKWLIVIHSPSLCPGSSQIKIYNYRVSKKRAKRGILFPFEMSLFKI